MIKCMYLAKLRLNSKGQFLLMMDILVIFQSKTSMLWLMQAGAALPERTELHQCLSGFALVIQKASRLL